MSFEHKRQNIEDKMQMARILLRESGHFGFVKKLLAGRRGRDGRHGRFTFFTWCFFVDFLG